MRADGLGQALRRTRRQVAKEKRKRAAQNNLLIEAVELQLSPDYQMTSSKYYARRRL